MNHAGNSTSKQFEKPGRDQIRARYVAERHEIAARYAEYELIEAPEIRDVNPDARYFSPCVGAAPKRPAKEPPKNPPRDPKLDPPDKEPPVKEPPNEDSAKLDGLERFLVLLALRRYVSWCARRRRFAAMQGAAYLYRKIGAT